MSIDFFNFFRYVLGVVVSVYATVVTLQSLYSWYLFLAGGQRYISLIRRYIVVQGLRLRFKTFWGDVLICLLLGVLFMLLWHARSIVVQIDQTAHGQNPHGHRISQTH